MAGEQGILRPVAGIVTGLALGRARVRCVVFGLAAESEYTWPVLNGAGNLQVGMRVLVFFTDERLSSGVVVGEATPVVDWRQVGAQWWDGYRASLLGRSAPVADGVVTWANVGTAFPLGEPDGYATVGGVLLPDGRVLCVPGAAATARIFDPATDSFTTSAAAWPWTKPGEYHLSGGVLLQDGRVFLAPRVVPYGYIYDPVADVVERTAALTRTSAGPLLLPDGTVLLAYYSQLYRYDAGARRLITCACQIGSGGVRSMALLPDGTVFMVALSSGAYRYDPQTDTAIALGGSWNTPLAPPVLLADGRLFCPAIVGGTLIYDPETGVMEEGLAPFEIPEEGSVVMGRLALLADGRVLCAPSFDGNGGIYDPEADTWTLLNGMCQSNGEGYSGAVLLPDGRVFCPPKEDTPAILVETGLPGGFDFDVLLSAYFNRADGIW